jgi:phage gpG-like protein
VITATLVGGDALAARLGALPAAMTAALAQATEGLGRALYARVERNLSGAVLQRRSGRLASSIQVDIRRSDSAVSAVLKTDIPYAAIHEYGGTLPARTILPKSGRALAFPWQGRERFFARVSVPPAAMPERSFMRSALEAMAPEIRATLTRTALDAAAKAVAA